MTFDDGQSVTRELELRLQSKHNALKIAIQQRDEAHETIRQLREELADRDKLPPMLGGWF